MKQVLGTILRAIAGIAAVVCVLSPMTGMGALVFVIALFVAIIAGVTGSHLRNDEDQGGYWPTDPKSPSQP
jgi:hypothetical protein